MPEPPMRWLIAVAAPKEVHAVLRGLGVARDPDEGAVRWSARPINDQFDLVVSGVGKACAAAAVARAFELARHHGVVNMGIAGSLPGSGLAIGTIVIADRCAYADEGMSSPQGFTSIADMGFGPLQGICGPGSGLERHSIPCAAPPWKGFHTTPFVRGCVASVSTCSGTDPLAHEVVRRTGAIAEDMEAAAIGFTLARLAPRCPFVALKVISNTTGDRAAQTWDIPAALARLEALARTLRGPAD